MTYEYNYLHTETSSPSLTERFVHMLRHIHCTTEFKTPIYHDERRGSLTAIPDEHDVPLTLCSSLCHIGVEVEENGCIIVSITRTELIPI